MNLGIFSRKAAPIIEIPPETEDDDQENFSDESSASEDEAESRQATPPRSHTRQNSQRHVDSACAM